MRGRLRRRGRDEVEFLPAALEIEESPPSPLGRLLVAAIAALVVAALAWAGLGAVDVVAVARGRIVPGDRSKVVQPLEAGIIRAILVRDGKAVRRGEVVLELDPTAARADEVRLVAELRAAEVHVARLRALLGGQLELEAPAGADPGLLELQRALLREQAAEHGTRLEAARLVVRQRQAALEAARAGLERLEALARLEAERADAFRRLVEQEYIARLQYLEAEQRRVDAAQELLIQRRRLEQEQLGLAEGERLLELVESEFRRARRAELTEWESRAASLAQEAAKAARRRAVQRLTAPVDGVVQQLAVHTVGGVVTPAQQLMVVVPHAAPLEVEAWLENKDIGFVRPGQAAEIKVEAFPFTRHGTVPGRIVSLSPDAVALDRLGLAYAARVSLDRTVVDGPEEALRLAPGMVVTVEVKIGTRRLLEFFLSPLLRRGGEAFRER